jgi:hypothetical protein
MKYKFEITLEDGLEKEFAEEYLEVIIKMFYLCHFVEAVTKAEIVEEKEFLVDYNEKYTKTVMARNAEEARKKVIDDKQGLTLYYETETCGVEEKR